MSNDTLGKGHTPAPPRAALDVGSNTVRLLVARPAGEGIHPLLDRGHFIRLGQGVDEAGRLNPNRAEAARAAISALVAEAEALGTDRVRAVATSAVRDAADGRAFVAAVLDQAGIDVEILSARREGELTYVGATLGLPLSGETIVADLGGRSTEIVAVASSGRLRVQSLPLGSGRLTDVFIRRDPPRRAELRHLADHVKDVLHLTPRRRVQTLILTGGTARQISRVLGLNPTGRRGRPTHLRLTLSQLDDAAAAVCDMPVDKAVRRFGVRPERAVVLPAGLTALREIARRYRPEGIIFTHRGLREGVLVESFRRDGESLAA
jgi:exopolyphosphatase/guanosine-5'-triphosphate,3'-diphosphate pyrophosphatase